MNKKIAIIIIVIVAVVAIIAASYLIVSGLRKKGAQTPKLNLGGAGTGVELGDIGKATANPLENMPATNPLENVANPFRDSYKNPFK